MKKGIFIAVLFIFLVSSGLTLFVVYKYNLESQKNIQPIIVEEVFVCQNNEECIPENKLLGMSYTCEDGKCVEKVFSNPASNNCQEKGGTLDMRKYQDGRSYGVCIFSDGSECEEWKFLKGTCSLGDFNTNDNIWEGNIVNLENNKYTSYFEMLNGDRVGIMSEDENIQSILLILGEANNIIKLSGVITDGIGYNSKELNITEIIDLGGIVLNVKNEEESKEIALQALMTSENYIKDKGSEIELFKINKVDCPYCWSFEFSYFIKKTKEYKFFEVIIQEGEVKDIAEIDNKLFNNCKEFALVKTCTEQYDPVCGGVVSGDKIEIQTFSNACKACTYSVDNEYIKWYKFGDCNQ